MADDGGLLRFAGWGGVTVDLVLSGGLFDFGLSSSPLGGDLSLSLSSFRLCKQINTTAIKGVSYSHLHNN